MHKKFSVLIPDGESHLLMYIINSLSQINGVKIYVMSSQKQIPMRYSRHIYNFSYCPGFNYDANWVFRINDELIKYKIDVLMPIFEKGIEAIIRYKNNIVNYETLCLLPTEDNFETAINKGKLGIHLKKYKIPAPNTKIYDAKSNKYNKLEYPLIVKPVKGFGGGNGVRLFNNVDDLKDYFLNNDLNCEHIVQEYIHGYDIGCSILCKNGVILAFTIQESIMNADNPFKPLLGVKMVYEKDLYENVLKLTQSLSWSGVAHVDFRYDSNSKTFKVIEVNTRFWRSLDASLMAGVNFPYLYCLASLNDGFELPKYKFVEHYGLKGLVKTIKTKPLYIFHFKFLLNNTPLKYALNDPLPMAFKYLVRTKVILKKYFRLDNDKAKYKVN